MLLLIKEKDMKNNLFVLISVFLLALSLPMVSYAATGTPSQGDQPAAHHQVDDGHGEESHGHGHAPHIDGTHMNLLWIIPFIGILLSIAIFPLVTPHFWHHNYGKVSLFWGVIFVIAFTIGYGPNVSAFYVVEVYLLEYIPFITLLLALFTVAGGIRLKGDLIGTPAVNGLIIFIGTILASWMGTTGAAMLLIRPLLRANAWRRYRVHTVVFFIFLVANIGGSLTPLGDPPLFLGFLKGVDFFWTTTHMFIPMVVVVLILMALFFAFDVYFYRKEPNKPVKDPEGTKLGIEGGQNLILVPAVVLAVLSSSLELGDAFTLHYVTVPTAKLLQVLFLLAITVISLIITKRETREGNEFTWEPILEVAKLFATIFITMVPPIAMLKAGSAGPMGAVIDQVITPGGEYNNSAFFWATGVLSSFLDNAPTYVVFFNTAGGNAMELMTTHAETLLAISTGAVFMGANSYIGNAPNFMVKSIAEEAGVNMPSFFGYIIKYTIPVLLPVFVIVTLIFFL